VNAGRPNGQLSACFVLPIGDSITEIFEALGHMATIQKAGGGTGFAFDELTTQRRPRGLQRGTTTGPIVFMGCSMPPPGAFSKALTGAGEHWG